MFLLSDGSPFPETISEQKAKGLTPVTIIDPDNQQIVTIKQKEVDCPHQTLGVHKTIIGDDTKQFMELKQKALHISQLVGVSQMTRHQARTSFHSIYLMSITYSFPACSLSEKQMQQIQAKPLEHFLPAMGWLRTTSRAMIHGPIEKGGGNIPHLYAVQCGLKIMVVLNHIRANTELGQLILININWLQLEGGRSIQLFQDHYRMEYIKDNWLTHIQQYMQQCNLQLKSSKFWTPKMHRLNDAIIMERAAQYTTNTKVSQI